MKAPVGLYSGNLTVVVVVVGVLSADEVGWDGITEKDTENVVLDGVGLVLIEGDQDEGVLHEVLVGEEWLEESAEPVTSNGDGGIVSIGSHVWSDEHPLWKGVGGKILVEEGGVLDLLETILVGDNRVVKNSWAANMLVKVLNTR